MKKIQSDILNQLIDGKLKPEEKQQLNMWRKKLIEFNLNSPKYFSAPNNYDLSCAIQKLKDLEGEGIKVNPAVTLILIALYLIGIDKKLHILFITFNEIKNYMTNLDDKTISKSLNFLYKNNLIIFKNGKGQRKSLIVLRIFNVLNN